MPAIRWGILGTGGIAHAQVGDLLANGFAVTAVGSRRQDSADAFAREFGIARSHGSYEALLADDDVDVVYVATPHPFHAPHATLALAAGKHVLVEKPFAMNAPEAAAVAELARTSGLVALEAMWTRYLPHMVRIRELLAQGTIGELRAVIADHNQALPTDPHHRLNDPALGGGALLDLGIYPVSFAHDVLGTPASVLAAATMTATGVDRQTAIVLGFADGAHAVLHTGLDALGPNTATIVGTDGRIQIDQTWYMPTTFTVHDRENAIVERYQHAVAGRGMQFQAWEVERLIAEGRVEGDILPPHESVKVMATLDEIRRQIGLVYPQER